MATTLTVAALGATVACSGSDGGNGSSGAAIDGPKVSPRELYQCPAPPPGVSTGTANGNQLPDYTVKDCEGNDVPLARFCHVDATWLFEVHTWCPHTRKIGKYAEALHNSYTDAGKNLFSVQILVQNDDHAPPTADDCKAWRALNHLANNTVLYDPAGVTRELNNSTFTALSVFLDKNQIIRGKSHSDEEADIRHGIDGALSAK